MIWNLQSISMILTLAIVVALLIYRAYLEKRNNKKETEEKTTNDEKEEIIAGLSEEDFIKLNQLRNYRYDLMDEDGAILRTCYVDKAMFEAFGMFISIGNDMLTLNLKLLHFVLGLHNAVTDENPDKEVIHNKLNLYTDCMDILFNTTDNFDDRMLEIYKSIDPVFNVDKLQPVPNDIIGEYCSLVRDMMNSVSEYLQICAIVEDHLKELYPEFIEEFCAARRTFLEIFFVEIFNCINMVDKSIYTKKPTNWKGVN